MTSPLTSHGATIPPELLYCPKLSPAVRDTWAQVRGLADENGKLELKEGIRKLAEITGKSPSTLYGHLAVLRDLHAITWRAAHTGELFVTFDDKSLFEHLSKILNTCFINPSFNNLDSIQGGDLKNTPSKILERDPNLEHPAVKVYRGIVHITANETQRKAIVEAVGYDVDGWRACLEHWRGHGWSPTNVTGMIQSYKAGGAAACRNCNAQMNGNGSKSSRVSPLQAEIERRKAILANGNGS